MKQFISPRLGAASVLAFFAFAAVHLSSCGGGDSKLGTPEPALLKNHVILQVMDSSHTIGGGTGGHPMLIVSCPNIDCSPLGSATYAPGPAATDSVAYVITATTTDAIPANTTLRFEIRMKKDTAAPM